MRQTKEFKGIEWYTYVDNIGVALRYVDGVVECEYDSKKTDSRVSDDWIDLINKSNPFGIVSLKSEYTDLFQKIANFPYDMNALQNRQILNGPTIMNKYISYDLNRRKKRKSAGCPQLSIAFERGAFFQALSKDSARGIKDTCKTYQQNYDNTMHDGRSNKAAYLLPNVTRASNDAVRNSKALKYPSDGVYYYCLLNTKDIKSAGEQNMLADNVLMSEETDPIALFNHIKSISESNGRDSIIINGYITNCSKAWHFDDLIELKKRFPHVTSKYYDTYVLLSTCASIPMKYSEQYDIFLSPAETTHFRIEYPEMDILSAMVKEMPITAVRKNPPAKTTVSTNNIKGSVATVTGEAKLYRSLIANSLGLSSYIEISKHENEKLIDYSVISHGHDTSFTRQILEDLHQKFDLELNVPARDTDRKSALKALQKLYPPHELLIECHRSKLNTHILSTNKTDDNIKNIENYLSEIFSLRNYKASNIWNFRLRAAFGNWKGACIEDGVVIDTEVLKHMPPVNYSACITVDFTFKTVKQPKESQFISIDSDLIVPLKSKFENADCLDDIFENEMLIGCLVTEHEPFIKHSKHNVCKVAKLGNHYYYFIFFLPKKTQMYENLKVKSIVNKTCISVIITGSNKTHVNVGCKLANAYGQKNLISDKQSLKDCWGITRDGRKVHAQLIYSDVSILGRSATGQLFDMINSPEVAIGPNGELIAPVDISLHTLNPFTNIKVFDVKIDTLTNINGFDSQNLSRVSHVLRSNNVTAKVLQLLGFHGFHIDFIKPTILPEPKGDAVKYSMGNENSNDNSGYKIDQTASMENSQNLKKEITDQDMKRYIENFTEKYSSKNDYKIVSDTEHQYRSFCDETTNLNKNNRDDGEINDDEDNDDDDCGGDEEKEEGTDDEEEELKCVVNNNYDDYDDDGGGGENEDDGDDDDDNNNGDDDDEENENDDSDNNDVNLPHCSSKKKGKKRKYPFDYY